MTSPASGSNCIELHRVTKRALLSSLPQGSVLIERNLDFYLRASVGRFVSWPEMQGAMWGKSEGPKDMMGCLAVHLWRQRKNGWRFKTRWCQGVYVISAPAPAGKEAHERTPD